MPAYATCARCGTFACNACLADIRAAAPICRECATRTEQTAYHVVPPWRVVAMSILTFGAYELWWSYKNWKAIKGRDNSAIWPFARGLFSRFTYFALINDLNTRARSRDNGTLGALADLGVGPALGYILIGSLFRLPDPYWMVSLLAGVCLYPAARRIAELEGPEALERSRQLRTGHYVIGAFCLLVMWPAVIWAMMVGE